ncbi:hypothetical protein HZS55_08005 [Halosimplex rubrum]|uniref:Uncharacterized protein n=1 Tax=Halosimplex rubrum TaxID=869889 RepID=A0A7D5P9V2_9EURY|nr:hypothetical protein [Halosimplex rubrum]QLH77239.1 hypothetical protein HZS55_08005 [Halosimplex rubrum]
MQPLSWSVGLGGAVATLLAVSALVATQSVAHPTEIAATAPNVTDHHDTDPALWSRDDDSIHRSTLRNRSGSAARSLATTTDIPFNRPPAAVAKWNRDQLATFPSTGVDTSAYPASASPTDGTVVRDAYVEIFTVQPSTRVRLTPERQPRYVAKQGQLFATLDYRVPVPEDSDTRWETITWALASHTVTDTTLFVDGDREATAGGGHVQRFDYDLRGDRGASHTLAVRANISASLTRDRRWCANRTVGNSTAGDERTVTCTRWETNTTTVNETLTVTDAVDVRAYALLARGAYARYPDGDLGLLIRKTNPWLGYRLPTGRVNGVWRFYSARDPGWDRLVTATASGVNVSHSPVHPLRISAYPFKPGPTVAPAERVSLQAVSGPQRRPPTLPPTIRLDVLEQPYTASHSLVTRFESPNATMDDLTIAGLVRGTQWDLDPQYFTEITIHRSNLTLTVLNTTARTATVRITLRDAQTGTPIRTTDTEGHVRVAGERVQTDRDGTVTTTVARPAGAISARFEPWDWWLRPTSYVGDSDAASVDGTVLTAVRYLYRAGIPVGLFLLAVFFIDRITGMSIWPPWRGL